MSKKPIKPKVNLSQFMEEINESITHAEQDNLTLVSQADPIISWESLPVKDETGKLYAFIMFTTESGKQTVLPLMDDNVNSLLGAIISQTPDLNRDTIPEMIPMSIPFKKKYRKTIILTTTLIGMFIITGILSTQFWLAWS